MEILRYKIRINASKKNVWHIMLDSETYREWAKAFSPNSRYIGQWEEGAPIRFVDPDLGGSKALLEEVKPYDRIHAKHVAVIDKNGNEDTDSDVAKTWMGTTETYVLKEVDGGTEISVEILSHKDFVKMFNDGFPDALDMLKSLCERREG